MQADRQRREHIQGLRGCGQAAAAEAFSLAAPPTREAVRLKYEEAHRSPDASGIKSLDYSFSRTTSKFNNLINTYVGVASCCVGGASQMSE